MTLKRHKKDIEWCRCCWICGKVGGAGFTTALRWLGYPVGKDEMAHAHPTCMAKKQAQLAKKKIK